MEENSRSYKRIVRFNSLHVLLTDRQSSCYSWDDVTDQSMIGQLIAAADEKGAFPSRLIVPSNPQDDAVIESACYVPVERPAEDPDPADGEIVPFLLYRQLGMPQLLEVNVTREYHPLKNLIKATA